MRIRFLPHRGVCSRRSRDPVRPIAPCDDSGGSAVAPVPGHDRRIRAGPDSRRRSRRGQQRHRAQQGQVNVLSGAHHSAIVTCARPINQPPITRSYRKPGSHRPHGHHELYTVQEPPAASAPLRAISTSSGLSLSAKGSAAGSDRHCGPCCAIPPTRVSPVSAKQDGDRAAHKAAFSPGPFGFAEASRLATALAMSAHAPTGLPFPYRRSSARILSRSPPNGWRPTKTIPPAAR